MDFDFYKNFQHMGSVKLGSELSGKFIVLESFQKLELFELKFPEGHEDAGNVMEVRRLEENRYELAKEISQMIFEECGKIIYGMKNKKVNNVDSPTNPEVLSSLLSMVLNTETTSFSMG
jgi:hypothetical protein